MQHLEVTGVDEAMLCAAVRGAMVMRSVAVVGVVRCGVAVGAVAVRAGGCFYGCRVRGIAEGELFGVLIKNDDGGAVAPLCPSQYQPRGEAQESQ